MPECQNMLLIRGGLFYVIRQEQQPGKRLRDGNRRIGRTPAVILGKM